MNNLYTTEWRLLLNFFLPSVKLQGKERVGSKTIKKHDAPQTPVQRLLTSEQTPPRVKRQLQQQLTTLNPFFLQHQISMKIKKILRYATPTQSHFQPRNQPVSPTTA